MLLLFSLLHLIGVQLWGQNIASILQPADTTYYQICTRMEAFLDAHPEDAEVEDGLSAKYGRWRRFWQNRVDNNGGFQTYANALGDLVKNGMNDFCVSDLDDDKNWLNLGPFNSDNISIHDQGRVESISVNPNNPLDILIGGDGSSVWRTANGGINWANTTDDEGYYSIAGVNSIVRHPTNPNWVYAATGSSGSGYHMTYDNRTPAYGIGVLYATDGGNTWTQSEIPDIAMDTDNTIFKAVTKIVMDPNSTSVGYQLYAVAEKKLLKATINNTDGSLTWQSILEITTAIWDDYIIDLEIETNGTIWFCNKTTLFRYNANDGLIQVSMDSAAPICPTNIDFDATAFTSTSIAINLDDEIVLMRAVGNKTITCNRLDFLTNYDVNTNVATWTTQTLPNNIFSIHFTIGAHNTNLIFAENTGRRIKKSTDGGIEVWGNPGRQHIDVMDTANPMTLISTHYNNVNLEIDDPDIVVLSNATIENGQLNTITTDRRKDGYWGNDYYGGIIYAESSEFINCRKAVEMMYYKWQNLSQFRTCTFSSDDNSRPFEGISIWACNGIGVDGCTFEALSTNPYNTVGITTHNAHNLHISDCAFNYLKFGTYLTASTAATSKATFESNTLQNTKTGLVNLQTSELLARGNNFTNNQIGILSGGTTGYQIQNNSFSNTDCATAEFFTSQNTPGNNRIDCNEYDNCRLGNYIYDNNGGLKLTDSTFATTQADNILQKGSANASIAFSQGSFDAPYFNLFSTNADALHFDATQGETETFLYFYHTDLLYTPEVNARLVPKCDLLSTCTPTNNFAKILSTFDGEYLGCLDLNGDGFPGDAPPDIADCQTKECYYAVKAYWENLKSEIDGGDKQALLYDLYNSPEALLTYQKYMAASPYLSDELLIAAAQSEQMSANHRANILLANAPLSDEAMYQIQDIVADNVYQLLYTIKYYTQLSARDNLNISISKETAKKEELLRDLLQKYSDEKDYANLDELLGNENTTYALRALIASKMEREDYAIAQSLLNALPADTPEEQDYKTVQQINLQHQTTTGTAFELSASQYAQLHSIADAQGYQAPAACALLALLRGEYCDWTLPEASESGKTETHPRYKTVPLLDKSMLNRLSIAPNPAHNSFEVTLPIYFGEQAGTVQIRDLSGKTLQSLPLAAEQRSLTVSTKNLPNGIYLVSYIADGISVSSAKVVVQH